MAYLQSRSGIARSGVTHCGWTPPSVRIYMGGVDRTSSVSREGFSIFRNSESEPSTCSFVTHNFEPPVGRIVEMAYAAPNDFWFFGNILEVEANFSELKSTSTPRFHCQAVGPHWLLDSYNRVTAKYYNRAVNHIVGDIVARCTSAAYGFHVGYVPSSLGTIEEISFTNELVSNALARVAHQVGATLEISPQRTVSMYTTAPHAALPTISNTSRVWNVRLNVDVSQLRTRVRCHAGGTVTTSFVERGAVVIPVEEIGWFTARQPTDADTAISGQNVITYTSWTSDSGENFGPGQLTGVSGVLFDIPSGSEIDLFPLDEDTAAQIIVSGMIGAGDGVIYHVIEDRRLGWQEAVNRINSDLDQYASQLRSFSYCISDRETDVGRTQVISLTVPITLSASLKIQSMEITAIGDTRSTASGRFMFQKRVTAAPPVLMRLTDHLKLLGSRRGKFQKL